MDELLSLYRQLLAKHGVDRYPTLLLSAVKLAEEVNELIMALVRESAPYESPETWSSDAYKEFGDVVLSFTGLVDKMNADSVSAAAYAAIRNETRTAQSGTLKDC